MKYKFLSILSLIAALLCGTQVKAQQVPPTTSDSVATVFFIKNITPENLVKIYDALDRRAKGKVCVKNLHRRKRKSQLPQTCADWRPGKRSACHHCGVQHGLSRSKGV